MTHNTQNAPDTEVQGPKTHTGFSTRWIALAVLVLPVFMLSVDMTVLGFALPEISQTLKPSGSQLLWIVDIYGFMIAGFLVTMGSLGDRIGRKKLLLIGITVFGLSSLGAAFSITASMLIVFRALMGVGGATLMPSTLAMIRNIFPDDTERRTAVAVWAAMWGGGTAAGPIVGGMLLEHFSWGSVFMINVPIMVLVLIMGALFIPESKNPTPGAWDPLSVVLSVSSILLIVYAVKHTAQEATVDSTGIACLIVGIVFLWVFIHRQKTMATPMLDLSLFKIHSFSAAVAINCITAFAFVGVMFFLPQYLQLIQQLSPLEAALWILPMAVASITGSLLSPYLLSKIPAAYIIMSGIALAVLGLIIFTQIDAATAMPVITLASLIAGFGLGNAETVSNDLVVGNVPEQRAGAASAVSETAVELGSALGTAILGSIATLVYSTHVRKNAPESIPQDVLDTATQTLGAALQVAKELPAQMQQAFITLVDNSFLSGMHTAMFLAIFPPLCAIFIAYKWLSPMHMDSENSATQENHNAGAEQ